MEVLNKYKHKIMRTQQSHAWASIQRKVKILKDSRSQGITRGGTGAIAKTGSNRSVEGQMDGSGKMGVHRCEATSLSHKEAGHNARSSLRGKSRMIIPRKGGCRERDYHMILLLEI